MKTYKFKKSIKLFAVSFLMVSFSVLSAFPQRVFALQTLTTAEYEDSDFNGTVDRIKLTFDENVTQCTYEAGDWSLDDVGSINIAITGITAGPCDGTVGYFYLNVTADAGETGGATAPQVKYVDGGANGSVRTASGNINIFAGKVVIDKAAPVILEAKTYDIGDTGAVHNGKDDHLRLKFSEPVDDSLINNYAAGVDYAPTSLAVAIVSNEKVDAVEGVCPLDAAEDDAYLCIIFDEKVGGCNATDQTGCDTGLVDQDIAWTGASVTIKDLSVAVNQAGNLVTGGVVESDGATPVIISRKYQDNGSDGSVDRLILGFSENVTWNANDKTQFAITANDLTAFTVVSAVAGSTSSVLTLTVGATANKTGVSGGTEPTVQYTGSGTPANHVKDAAVVPNDLANDSAPVSIVDNAKPVITDFAYSDDNHDGRIDSIGMDFSERILAASHLANNDLLITNVGDFTAAAFGSDATDLITLNATSIAITLGTPASVYTTHDNSGTLAISSQNGFSLTDGTNVNSTLGAQSSAFIDYADPVILDFKYQDNDNDGKIDQFLLTYSETVKAASVLGANDLNLTNAGDFTGAAFGADATDLITGDVTSTTVILGTEATAVDTNSAGLQISSQNAFSLTDGANVNNILGAQSLSTFTDDAHPVLISVVKSKPAKNRLTFTYSENMTVANGASTVTKGDITPLPGVVAGFGSFATVGDVTVPTTKNTVGGNGTAIIFVDLADQAGGTLGIDSANEPSGEFTPEVSGELVDSASNKVNNLLHQTATGGGWDLTKPTITAGKLLINDTGCSGGSPATCEIGEHMIFTWDNSVATGDGNTDLNTTTVKADLSNFGGVAAQLLYDDGTHGDAVGSNQIYTYDYTVLAGDDDGVLPFTLTAADLTGNVRGPITSTDTTEVYNVSTGNLSSTNVQPASLSAGALGQVTLSFDTANPIPATGKIKAVFPAGFNVTGATGGTCSTMNGNFATSVTGQTVTITRSAGNAQPAASETCTIDGILNPQISGSAGTYTLQTANSSDIIIDQDAAVTADTITAGSLIGTSVTLTSLEAGQAGNVQIAFTTVNPLPANGKIKVTFPTVPSPGGANFNLGGITSASCDSLNGSISFAVNGQDVVLTRGGLATIASAGAHTCTISNVVNPNNAQLSGEFKFFTMTNGNVDIDKDETAGTVTLTAHPLTGASVALSDYHAGQTPVTATVNFTTTTAVPNDGKIKVTFPIGFTLSIGGATAGTYTSASGTAYPVSNVDLVNRIVTLTGDGTNTGIASSVAVSFTLSNIKNPMISGVTQTFDVKTTTVADVALDGSSTVPAVSITSGVLTGTNVEPATFNKGDVGNVVVSFTTVNPVPNSGRIDIVFPVGFTLSSGGATTITAGGTYNGTIYSVTDINNNQITLIGNSAGAGIAASDTVSMTFSNIKNPTTPGPTGTYSILTEAGIVIIDQKTDVASDIIRGLRSPLVSLSNTVVNQLSNLNISFRIAQPIPATGQIVITVPVQIGIAGVNGQVATSLTGIDGTLTAAVAGQVITITRAGGTQVASDASVSFTLAGAMNGPTAGLTGTYIIQTKTAGGAQTIDEETAVPAVTLTEPPAATPTATTPSGGGGGGGGGGVPVNTTSNKSTSSTPSTISTIAGDQTYSRPVMLESSAIIVDTEADTKTAALTENGTLTLKPNSQSTISMSVPPNTSVEGTTKWDGRIDPPLVQSVNVISAKGETINGSDETLLPGDVAIVIKAGSEKSTLTFSNKIKIDIPVDLPEGTQIKLYSSKEGNAWDYLGTGIVVNGMVTVETDHLTYFAVGNKGEVLHGAAPSAVVKKVMAFKDIAGHWAKMYIEDIASRGIVSGKTSTKFAPDDNITRAELTKIAVEALFDDSTIENCLSEKIQSDWAYVFFPDVLRSAWYAKYVCVAKDNGVVSGVAGMFNPNNNITRAEALKILFKAAGFTDIDQNYKTNYSSKPGWTYVSFPDALMGEWYAKYVAYAKDFGIVGGYSDNTFRPANTITRAEVAKIVVKILELVK